jgi:hypothetical protein
MQFKIPKELELDDTAIWVEVEDTTLVHRTYVQVRISPAGELIASGVYVLGNFPTPVRAQDLRIPLARIVSKFAALSATALKKLYEQRLPGEMQMTGDVPLSSLLNIPGRSGFVPRTRPGRGGHTHEHYRKVAATYTRAKRTHPDRPMKVLADELNVAEPTAYRWVREARKRHLLEQSTTEEESA